MKESRYLFVSVCILVTILFLSPSKGADTEMAILFVPQTFTLEEPGLSTSPLLRFSQELVRNEDALNDKLGYQSSHKWARQLDWFGYSLHDEVSKAGLKATSRILSDSASETALAVLPTEEWKENILGGFFADGFSGTFGNTVESRSNEDSLSQNADVDLSLESRQNWIRKLANSETIFYGVKPFRTTPYAYFGTRLGHWGDEDLPIVVWETRFAYKAFRGGRLWTSLVFPVSDDFNISASLSSDLYENEHNVHEIVSSFRFEHVLSRGKNLKAVYFGVRNDSQRTYATVGFIKPL